VRAPHAAGDGELCLLYVCVAYVSCYCSVGGSSSDSRSEFVESVIFEQIVTTAIYRLLLDLRVIIVLFCLQLELHTAGSVSVLKAILRKIF
jgi:hypothetical protein